MTPDERRLLGWADVLQAWPNAGPRPRVDIIPVGEGRRGVAGTYDLRRHAIRVFANPADPEESLCTLIHEFGHAWAKPERSHHGLRWREVYLALYTHLTGLVLDLPQLIKLHADLPADQRAALSFNRRVGDNLTSSLIDLTLTVNLCDLHPQISQLHDPTTGELVHVAAIGPKIHSVKVKA